MPNHTLAEMFELFASWANSRNSFKRKSAMRREVSIVLFTAMFFLVSCIRGRKNMNENKERGTDVLVSDGGSEREQTNEAENTNQTPPDPLSTRFSYYSP